MNWHTGKKEGSDLSGGEHRTAKTSRALLVQLGSLPSFLPFLVLVRYTSRIVCCTSPNTTGEENETVNLRVNTQFALAFTWGVHL